MVIFPNAKINIGLRITGKRKDGYHSIQSIFYPIPFQDALEAIPAESLKFEHAGYSIPEDQASNTVLLAYKLLEKQFKIPPVHFYLLKNLPLGAGLGGGSADGTFALKLLNQLFDLDLSVSQLHELAGQLGSDCPFFVANKPALVTGRGEEIQHIPINLTGFYLVIIHPNIEVSTGKAYQHITPKSQTTPIDALVQNSIDEWPHYIQNDFEDWVFSQYPEIAAIKKAMYDHGAAFAAMSGSGSSVYGIFRQKPSFEGDFPDQYRIWEDWL